jgi:Kef-type K+ transport system membrane component KefB
VFPRRLHAAELENVRMDNVWLASALWIGLALLASIISIRMAMSVALVEIMVGAVAGNAIGLDITPWVNFLAGFGAIMLTFLAGTEIDSQIIRKKLGPSVGIGVASFAAPYVGMLLWAHYVDGWTWPRRRSRASRFQPRQSQSSTP